MPVLSKKIQSALCLASLASILGLGSFVQADAILQFAATGDPTGTVSYDNTSGVVSGTNIPVYITLYTPNSYGPNPVEATFSFSADTSGTAQSIFGGLIEGVPVVSNITYSLTADAPVNGQSDILSGTASSGGFSGNSAGFTLSAQNPTDNDGITYTSNFINVAALNDYSFQFNFADPITQSGASPEVNAGVLDSFTADLSPGTFVASPVPEPASAGVLIIGSAVALMRRRKRPAEISSQTI